MNQERVDQKLVSLNTVEQHKIFPARSLFTTLEIFLQIYCLDQYSQKRYRLFKLYQACENQIECISRFIVLSL